MIGANLRQRLERGDSILMTNPHHVSTGLAKRLCELGSDTIFIDCEHGSAGFEDVREMANAARQGGGGAIVRPDSHQRSLIIRYLNSGADGIMVPMVNTAAQAQAVVDAVRYACPTDYQNRLIICMIETLDSVENIDMLLKVDGVDVFFIGPGDLSQAMGHPPTVALGASRPADVLAVMDTTVAKIRQAGKIAGTLVTLDEAPYWRQRGCQFFYIHSDPYLRSGLAAMRGQVSP
ncbi:aldolase/citrate lyase family protein [Nguyenibacter sp. L1]|uniref:HpcH/HpaI aldolase family protein n=1 Tax=Nguyenibacter sp. L1 TaxID=3049350 RepID=UPI002B49F2C3|nr:aldolase/citrate lyase family protein [Nguyenibacter sp. L1]WRH89782.1 aldolase/citrate lyase family protein [Nguyenibacter sp. L1]